MVDTTVNPWDMESAADLNIAADPVDLSKIHPSDMTPEQVNIASQQTNDNYEEMSAIDVAGRAVTNFPSSFAGVVSDIYTAITNPSDTLNGILKAVYGAGAAKNKLILGSIDSDIAEDVGETLFNNQSTEESIQASSAIAEFYAERYGSLEGLKKAVAEDPASVMADAATVLSTGAGLGSKVGLPLKATETLAKTASYVDPIMLLGKGVAATGKAAGTGTKFYTGTASGAGVDAVEQAYKSGAEGGASAEAFTGAMRGNIDIQTILTQAKDALLNMKIAKNNQYKANQKALSANKQIITFSGIDDAVTKALNMVVYKGEVINEAGFKAVKAAQKLVNDWKAKDPSDFHTPVDIDQLKQKIYSIVEKQEYGSQARLAVNQIRNGIDKEIKVQSPSYSKMMEDYSRQAGLVEQLEKAFKLGDKASQEAAIRALQQSVRNNLNTGFGMKKQLAENLDSAGGSNVLPMAAGSSLNSPVPRGIQGATAVPAAFVANSVGGIPLMLANVAASSPRFVGEAAFKAGQLSRATQGLLGLAPDVNVGQALNLIYQSQQPKEQQ